MQALILAAGMGKRLKPITNSIPKCLVEVNNTPLLFNTLDILCKKKMDRIIIVVGYLKEMVKERVGSEWKGTKIIYVENKEYLNTNNIYSLFLAKDYLTEDTLLLECDVYFEEAVIDQCLKNRNRNIVLVDIFTKEMNGTAVEINKDKRITKIIPSSEQTHQFDISNKYKTVNIYFFQKSFLNKFFVPNLELYIRTQGKKQFYEIILAVLMYSNKPLLTAEVINKLKWIEIDDINDLNKANYLFSDQKEKLNKIKTIHGGFWNYDFLDFSYLYNSYFPPIELVEDLKNNIHKLITNYPSAQKDLVKILSNWVEVDSKYLAIGNGASEIIRIINKNVTKKIVIPIPTFNEYENSLSNDNIVYYHLEEPEFNLNPDIYIKKIIESKSNITVIINPNNPTSQVIEREKLIYILENLPQTVIILIDESFIDFSPYKEHYSLVNSFYKYKNLCIIKSLSKNLGIPGLRLGYLLSANENFIQFIQKNIPIWNINSIAEFFLELLPKYKEEYEKSCVKVIRDTNYLYNALRKINGIKPLKPSANYVFAILSNGIDSENLRDELFLKGNILIKDCSNKTGLGKKYVRISGRRKTDIDKLIACLKKIINVI